MTSKQAYARARPGGGVTSRFVLTALVLLAVFFAALTRIAFLDRHVIAPYTLLLARSVGMILRIFGTSPVTSGTSVSTSGFSATIVPSCTAIEIMAMLCAVILAFPAPVRHKWIGMLWGLTAVHVLNVARLVVLFLIGMKFRSGFDQAHYYYAQGFLLLATVGIWALWVSRLPQHDFANRH